MMKKLLFYFVLLGFFSAVNTHAALGRNNVLVSVGIGATTFASSPTLPIIGNSGFDLNTEIGYLLHSVRDNKTIHGLDIRLGMDFALPMKKYQKTTYFVQTTVKIYYQQLSGYFNMTYTVGRQIGAHRLMFDILGAGVGVTGSRVNINTEIEVAGLNDIESSKTGNWLNQLRVDVILPLGIKFLMDNGFNTGFRQYISMNGGNGLQALEYKFDFNFGYAWGK